MNTQPESYEVMALRKEGKIEEALELAERLADRNPASLECRLSLGWALYSSVKKAIEENSPEAQTYWNKLLSLDVSKSDNRLSACIKNMERRMKPYRRDIEAAETLSKQGEHERAIAALRRIDAENPGCDDIKEKIGWALYRSVSQKKEGGWPAILPLMREYAGLFKQPGPSLLHSLMLNVACATYEMNSDFHKFVSWWGLKNLRDEDLVPYTSGDFHKRDGDTPASLAENVALKLYKHAKRIHDYSVVDPFVPFLEDMIGKNPGLEWHRYNHGVYLAAKGESEQAESFLLPIVQKHRKDYWVWESLSKVYMDDRKTACLAKAMRCAVSSAFPEKEKKIESMKSRLSELGVDVSDHAMLESEARRAEELVVSRMSRVVVACVERVNREKRVVTFRYSVDAVALAYGDDIPASMDCELGGIYRIAVVDTGSELLKAIRIDPAADGDDTPVRKMFSGEAVILKGNEFGFVSGLTSDIYIPPYLAGPLRKMYENGNQPFDSGEDCGVMIPCTGIAIKKKKKKDGKIGWEALTCTVAKP